MEWMTPQPRGVDGGPAEPAGGRWWPRWSACRSGLPSPWLLARGRFWGRSLLNGLVLLPLILPPVVTGYILLLLFGRAGPIGGFLADHFGIVFSFRWTGAALACGVMGFPLMVRAIRLSIEAVDARLEEAAGTLGRQPRLGVPDGDTAADRARHHRRHDPVLRQGHGRVRRHHHLRVEHPRRDADAAVCHLHLHAGAGRRCGAMRLTLVSVVISMLALLASELMARRANRRLDIE